MAVTLANVVDGDNISASAGGTRVNPDAGKSKIVYVSGITLSDTEHYTLSTTSLHTTVNIDPIKITGFEISALDKKYDGNKMAEVSVDSISDVLAEDKGLVSLVGNAEFENENTGDDKQVTFTPTSLAGTKAANYTLANVTATTKANIQPLKVNFVIGQTSFFYDGTDKNIIVSATDENGKVFKDFVMDYDTVPNAAGQYTAKIKLNDAKNYITNQGDIAVTVSRATQDQLVIAGMPGTVEYGDTFKLEAFGGAVGHNSISLIIPCHRVVGENGSLTGYRLCRRNR